MEVQELMIGNYVRTQYGGIVKVESIGDGWVNYDINDRGISGHEYS